MHRQVTIGYDRPPAGADWSIMPSSSDRVRLLSITATLTTSAVVANRFAQLEATDQDGNVLAGSPGAVAQVASAALSYSYMRDISAPAAGAGGTWAILPLPSFWLPAGSRVKPATTGLDVADQWSQIVATFLVCDERYLHQVEYAIGQALAGA